VENRRGSDSVNVVFGFSEDFATVVVFRLYQIQIQRQLGDKRFWRFAEFSKHLLSLVVTVFS
jgi:hypothetical protein